MIDNIVQRFEKEDYIKYLFLLIIFFIILNNFTIITPNNVIAVVFSIVIVYLLISKYLNDIEVSEKNTPKIENIDIDKLVHLKNNRDIMEIIVKIQDLNRYNPIKFQELLESFEYFYTIYDQLKTTNLVPIHLYENAYETSKGILNILLSYYMDLNINQSLVRNREYSKDRLNTEMPRLNESIKEVKIILSKRLNEMESGINKEWLEGKINIYSKPIYPDDPEPSILDDNYYDDRYNIY